ncbi:ligand-binding sensor domain-containing diguanylate cyclase [Chiayiivirga flava]|uniref:diguanylate cyclase n=1 Tax=Chiayiivirga flava TaxID=659595 RepID=A0A7W8D5J5_9GAMM|nr:ligand-binding sensor domain-containing diguanylate cyclase [Chiayiivirga flava]MBB5208334.1 diguanylate cyclase (GGDEF)-like protein [Chiayiivirga flava]
MSRWGLLLVALAWLPGAAAQTPRPLDQYTLERWDTSDGLPHSTVQAIAQTADGYLWLGTWEGLVRYNGREMRVFDRVNTPTLGDNGIRVLHAARDGSLWIGTARNGVVQLAGSEWRRFGREQGLPLGQTEALAEDAQGRIYVANSNVLLARIERDGTVRRFALAGDAAAAGVGAGIAVDRDGTVWLGSSAGLLALRNDVLEQVGIPGEAGAQATAVGTDASGAVLAVVGGTLYRHDAPAWTRLVTLDRALARTLETVHANRRGEIFLGTQSSGLLRLWNGALERLDASRGLPNDRVPAVFEDREHSIWVGTNAGLARLRETAFASYTERKGLSDDYVRSLVERADGSLWIGTSRGLNRLADGRFTALFREQGLASDGVLSLMEDRDGALWVGSYDAGITVLRDGAAPQRIGPADGLPAPQVRALLQTRDGTVWAGGPRGLARREGERFVPVPLADSGAQVFVLSLYEDAAGTLWVGTVQGVAQVIGGTLRRWDGGAAFAAQDVFGFHEDERGVLWIAGDDALYRVRNGIVARLDEARGVPHVPVFGVLDDGFGRFWLTSNRGAFRARRAALDAVADGLADTVAFEVFRESAGLASSQFSGAAMTPQLRRRDGSLWFATAKGVAMIDPNVPEPVQPDPPPVVIEQVLVDGLPVDPTRDVRVGPGVRKLEIHYAGLSYVLPTQIRYRVMMEGLDRAWDLIGNTGSMVYTGLPPGDYRFRAEADNGGGNWGATGASLQLNLRPHVWERSWFPPSVAAFVVLAGLWIARARIVRLRARTLELEHEVALRTRSLQDQATRLEQADAEKTDLLNKLRKQSEAFARQAQEDALTGLPNRRSLDYALSRRFADACAAGAPLSVAIADIDHFKKINDNYSHETGDQVLRAVASILREGVRTDDVVGRYGGEEFLLLFPGLGVNEAATLCERLRRRVAGFDFASRYSGLEVTVSIGLADHATRPGHEGLLSAADVMLYEAKNAGRNRVCWRRDTGTTTDAPGGAVS